MIIITNIIIINNIGFIWTVTSEHSSSMKTPKCTEMFSKYKACL